ncbi:MAG: putative glycoside hydrolase [Treponema sp.]|nr:putative glycoside hydrolase [Treponema sp.]
MLPKQPARRMLSVTILSLIAIFAVMPETPGTGRPQARWKFIAGTDRGLYGVSFFNTVSPIWTGGSVRKLIKGKDRWIIQSDQGVLVSEDLVRWESRNGGLPVKTIKLYRDGEKSFETLIQEIKDLEIDSGDPDTMVCATKDTVYLTQDGGRSWESLGMPPYRTNGIKAVAVARLGADYAGSGASRPPEPAGGLTVFLSHSTYGVHYIQPGRNNAGWAELNTGIEKLETTGNSDEVSDIAAAAAPPGQPPAIYAAQTFRRRVYRLDWERKRFDLVWTGRNSNTAGSAPEFGTVDSLDIGAETLRFVTEGEIMEISRADGGPPSEAGKPGGPAPLPFPRARTDLRSLALGMESHGMEASCIGLWKDGYFSGAEGEFISLSELWLLKEGASSPAATPAANREGLYMPANHAMEDRLFRPYLDLIEKRGLDMVVIDMKDDYGRLRFVPENPDLAEKGRVFRPVDIAGFLAAMKERGIYTAARIVVFKDPELAKKERGKYAVWDGRAGKPWAGYYDTRQPQGQEQKKNTAYETEILPSSEPGYEILRTYYDERWVDPYSEEVWEYTASVAEELHRRGFDEIQFDYIRFPTDGQNLGDARYRWRENGMDMESAMLSFLRHIRSRISAPISVDIYGANGWYRTGARTGQEVELMAPYVDVICPMYYPSHFEQDFLANSPAELRPYRIYYQGTQRTARIGRGRVIVRPYVQAFYLNVAYDRKYYNTEYVRLETEGVRSAGTGGLTYWNNSGRYDDIPLKTLGN